MKQRYQSILLVSLFAFLIAPAASAVVIKNDFRVNDDTTIMFQWTPQVGFDSSGNFVVVWGSYRRDYMGVEIYKQNFFRRFDSLGNPLGEVVLFSDSSAHLINVSPSVSVHADGHFVIAWASLLDVGGPSAEYDIWVEQFDKLGNPITSTTRVDVDRPSVFQDGLAKDYRPSVSVDSAGNYVVCWQTDDSTGHGIWGQLFNANGTRRGSNFKISDPTGSSLNFTAVAQFPNVKMHADGSWIVTWQGYVLTQNGNNYMPAARIYNADGSPKTPMVGLIVPWVGLSLGNMPDVDLAPGGKYVFTWNGNDNSFSFPNNAIYTQIFDSLLNPVSGFVLASDVEDLGTIWNTPRVKVAADGSYLIIWYDSRNHLGDLWGQRFDANGNPVGVNYRLNSITNSLNAYSEFDYGLDIRGDKVVLVWADARNIYTYNMDVYAKIARFQDIGIYIPGDLDMDGQVSLADVMVSVNHIFRQYPLYPLHPADVNADCQVTLADVIAMVNYLFHPPWQLKQSGCMD